MPQGKRSTPPGQHRPIMLDEVLTLLGARTGQRVVDCTVGWAGHAVELLRRIGPEGFLLGLDMDSHNLPRARERLETVGHPFALEHANFAALPGLLAQRGQGGVDFILADLGMSSMQVDDPERGFSYARDGALDMRMDQSRGRTAAQILHTVAEEELATALAELGDEPSAVRIAAAIVAARASEPIERTGQLAEIIQKATGQGRWRLHPSRGQWNIHPAARTFQALRILVNRELANLSQLLRVLPDCLGPEGKAVLISFHSGEDRLVKKAFRAGKESNAYSAILEEPLRAGWRERQENPRSRSAKLRWAVRAPSASR